MANEIRILISGGEQFDFLGANFEKAFQAELATALDSTLNKGKKVVRNTIREANAVASGIALNSVTALINSLPGLDWRLAGEVAFSPPADSYIEYADHGRGAGKQPPLERIVAWTRIKGIDENLAYPIARSIGAYGTNIGSWSQYDRSSFLVTSSVRIGEVAKTEFEKIAARLQRRVDSYANTNTSRS